MSQQPAFTIGLTGGIGSGKSVVLAELVLRGAIGIEADDLAREVVEPGTDGFQQVVDAFGTDVVAADGGLDRARLAAIVFADADQRRRLEAIVHPLVRAETGRRIAAAPVGSIVVNAVPLLFESGLAGAYDAVVVVMATWADRLDRLQARGMSVDQAVERMNAQATDVDRESIATWVITNDGTIERLAAQVDRVWAEIRASAAARIT
ncbi:MAG TPA: dephospho-CoA kinase [Acidothermaceae bacterium]